MDARRYITSLSVWAIVVSALVVGVNYLVDPYGITGAPRIEGFNASKADINDFARQFKKYQPLQRQSDTLIVGNSRAEMGIDPTHVCLVDSDGLAYNLAMPGAGVRMQLNYALNVMHDQPVSRIFLSVDFIDFISEGTRHPQPTPLMDQREGELKFLPDGERNPAYDVLKLKDYARALYSLDALTSAARTVLGQQAGAADRTTQGFNPANDMVEIVRVEGARALYDQKMQNLRNKYSQRWVYTDIQGRRHAAFDDLDAFLLAAQAQGIEVIAFTHPFHASYWSLFEEVGLMADYAQWLDAMQRLFAQHQPTVSAFWDFSGESPYLAESFGEVGERDNALRWFWEPAHYRSELGDKMVADMLGAGCEEGGTFGRRLL